MSPKAFIDDILHSVHVAAQESSRYSPNLYSMSVLFLNVSDF
jgi:hypothetical protein